MADLRMPDFNKVILAARLTRDPKARVLPNGMAINKQHVQTICRLLRFVADNAPSIQAHCIAHADECLAALDPPRKNSSSGHSDFFASPQS